MPKRKTNPIALDPREENELAKIKLAAEFGTVFGAVPRMPASIERAWLARVAAVEREASEARRISVASFLGFPKYLPERRVSDRKLSAELARVQADLEASGIVVRTLYNVPPRELYRFLTEDLMWEEIDDIRPEDVAHQFVYEEYFPNEEFEIEHTLVEFFDMLFGKYYSMLESIFYVEDGEMGDSPAHVALVDRLCRFADAFDEIYLRDFRVESIRVDGTSALARAQVIYTGHPNEAGEGFTFSGLAEFRLRVDRYGYWTLESFAIPGVAVT